jgi:hypothetical protein
LMLSRICRCIAQFRCVFADEENGEIFDKIRT